VQSELQISARGLDLDERVETAIRLYAERLERYHSRITAVRVAVEVPQRQMGAPIMYHVSFNIVLPHGEVVIRRQAHPNLLTAIQRAWEAARRRLQDFARRQRHEVKVTSYGQS